MKERKYTGNNVPAVVFDFLHGEIQRRNLEYADNFRFAPSDDPEGLREFEEMREHGCCGSWEGSVADASGRTWHVGCNYGH